MIDSNYAETLFNHLYQNVNGYNVSSTARANSGMDTEKLLYGELPFATWKAIVEYANPKEDGVFFDLGSGTGRVVMQSHLLFNFRKSVGVELLAGLYEKACEVKEIYEQELKPNILPHVENREVEFVQNDIFQTDLREADLIFMNHPFKDGDDFLRLEEKFLSELKPGTKIATTIRSLKNPAFKNLGSQSYTFSWGESTTHFAEV